MLYSTKQKTQILRGAIVTVFFHPQDKPRNFLMQYKAEILLIVEKKVTGDNLLVDHSVNLGNLFKQIQVYGNKPELWKYLEKCTVVFVCNKFLSDESCKFQGGEKSSSLRIIKRGLPNELYFSQFPSVGFLTGIGHIQAIQVGNCSDLV